MVLASKSMWKLLSSIILVIMISFVGIFEAEVLKKIIGIYQLASIIVIMLIIMYLLFPLTISSYLDLVVTSIIISLTVLFIYVHNDILWSSKFSGLSTTVLPFLAIVRNSFSSGIMRPVLEIDWGQVMITLVLLKIWISLLKYFRSLKF